MNSDKISNLPAEVYETTLKEIIQNTLKCDDYEILYSPGCLKGDNYLGELIRIQVKSKEKNLNLMLKIPVQNEARRKQLDMSSLFYREIKFYDEVMPMYKKFQEEKGIKAEVEGFHEVPFCYKTLLEAPFEAIFLEDLKENFFAIFPRKKTFTRNHVHLVVKALAKKHAISFCLKDQKPELIENYRNMSDLFHDNYSKKSELTYQWVSAQIELATKTILKLDESDFKTKVLEILENDFFDQLAKTVDGKVAEPYAVICHGDCWNNNVMFRNDETGNVVETKLLDFQILRYASPITDLAYIIFACTSKSLRDRHYQEFIDLYYETLMDFVKRLGSKPSEIFPRDSFEDHLRRFSKYALLMLILIVPSCISDSDDIPDMNDLSDNYEQLSGALDSNTFIYISANTIAMYEERLLGIFQDMYDLGYI